MHLKLDMSKVWRFAQFDPETNVFSVGGSRTKDREAGFYRVGVLATFLHGNSSHTVSETFMLEIKSKPPVIDPGNT